MAFTPILIGIAVVYVVYYAVVIIYDLYFNDKNQQLKVEDEEIEIAAEDNAISTSSYTPSVSASSNASTELPQEESVDEEEIVVAETTSFNQDYSEDTTIVESQQVAPAMNGGLLIEDLCQQVNEMKTPEGLEFVVTSYE
ncbi:MAG: hypothetical protein HXK16_08695 [Alloprevotella sp.]|jgi:hypothetical protein|nr:hypothetical protein [Alloprevotella sp.]